MTGGRDYSRELYPFLYDRVPADETALAAVVEEARQSTLLKCSDVITLRHRIQSEYQDQLIDAAEQMARRFAAGGVLLAMGNGGSATDANDAAADCLCPPLPGWRALPALDLTGDVATLTAVANDVGYEKVFLRQVIAFATRDDIAIGFSTSGNSASVLEGLAEARRRGLLTIAVSGNDGGAMARPGTADFCFIARAEHVPRIQEGHATIWHALLDLVQAHLEHPAEVAA